MPPKPSHADFSKVSEQYRNNAVAAEEAKKRPSRPPGVVVTTTPSTEAVFDSFFDALDLEVVLPVVWLKELPEGHPIRQAGVHVRLWDGDTWNQFVLYSKASKESVEALGFKSNGELLNWWLLSVSTCNATGQLLFVNSDKSPISLLDLQKKYSGPKHLAVVESIIETAMEFNGLKSEVANRDAKKPEPIDSSTFSAESSKQEAAPSETQPAPPQKSLEQQPS